MHVNWPRFSPEGSGLDPEEAKGRELEQAPLSSLFL